MPTSVPTLNTVERDLVERLRRGDQSAVTDLSSRYGTKIFQLAFRYVKNHEDADEVVQDVLLKVYRKIEAFRGDSALSSWIYRITFNTAMSRLRRTKAARALESSSVDTAPGDLDPLPRLEPADWSKMADERILRRQLRTRFAEAVWRLPAIYRAPVILRDLRGLSTEEASLALRLNDQTLKSRLHRGRSMLRQQLAEFAGGLTLHRARLQNS